MNGTEIRMYMRYDRTQSNTLQGNDQAEVLIDA